MLGIGWKVAGVMAFVALGAGAWGMQQRNMVLNARADVAAAQAEKASAQTDLGDCAARLSNILEAQANADFVDSLDLDQFDVPAHWMRPQDGSGGATAGN